MSEKLSCNDLQEQYREVKRLGDAYKKAVRQTESLAKLDEQYKKNPNEHPRKQFEDAVKAFRENLKRYGVPLEQAREIMGEDRFIGPEDIQNTFGFTPEDIPAIRFSQEELIRAKELGHHLILYVDTKEGEPFTTKEMIKSINNEASDGDPILNSQNIEYLNRAGIGLPCSRHGWRLTSPEITEGTIGENYFEQTEVFIDYLRDTVFKGAELPKTYQEAITELETKRGDISDLFDSKEPSDWRKATEQISTLSINQLTRENFAEALYRLILAEKKNSTRNLKNTWTWTNTSGFGRTMCVGIFRSEGLSAYGMEPEETGSIVGACLSRSA